MNILFTTREERCESWKQLHQTILAFSTSLVSSMKPISIDIDIFPSLSSFKDGQVTLRSFDNCGPMDPLLVSLLRHCAGNAMVPYFKDTIGTAIVEPGFLAQHTGGVFRGAHIGIPLINYHTDKEQTYWSSVYNIVKLVHCFLSDTIIIGEQICHS
jgi:putative aminopeptidase FrvX